jgi:hypothetical protein
VPGGLEIAWLSTEAAIDRMVVEADETAELLDMPVASQMDCAEAFPNAWRSELFANTEKLAPELLRYTLQCYEGAGQVLAVQDGCIVKQWKVTNGVWQGDPLGGHHMVIAIYNFLQAIVQQFHPEHFFRDLSESPLMAGQDLPVSAYPVWIIDDFTNIARRRHVLDLVRWVIRNAPLYGIDMNLAKWYVYMPQHRSEQDVTQAYEWIELERMGATMSATGLHRLLGAPIGTVAHCTKVNGHLDRMAANAADFAEAISTMDDPRAEYGMLLYCSSQTLSHLPRLMPSPIVTPYAARLKDSIQKAVDHLLMLPTITDDQRAMVELPTREGGWGLTSAFAVMQQAYVGCHGATIRWLYKTSQWTEASHIVNALLAKPQLRMTVDALNAVFHHNADSIKAQPIDYDRPDLWPTQSELSKIMHYVTANELEQKLQAQNPQLASWFASKRLPLANSSLRTIPALHIYKVSSSLFRTQLAISIMAPVSGLKQPGAKCPCGYAGSDMMAGTHFISRCNEVTMNTTRHNAVVDVFGQMIAAVGWEKKDGESANWVPHRPDLRPFDLVFRTEKEAKWQGLDFGCADPTRLSLLPTGKEYFAKGKAAARLENKKKLWLSGIINTYGPLKREVDYRPVGVDVTSGLGVRAHELFKQICSEAGKKGITAPSAHSTWPAQSFAAYWGQRISHTISKLTAIAVHLGVKAVAKEANDRL